jgi:hypothetical protein
VTHIERGPLSLNLKILQVSYNPDFAVIGVLC